MSASYDGHVRAVFRFRRSGEKTGWGGRLDPNASSFETLSHSSDCDLDREVEQIRALGCACFDICL